ncbi:MAG TPA: protein kinase, partial [Gemmataceae bacterium]|nr:protein kinase [Gemmataceae bacterium]
ALKILKADLASSPTSLRRFRAEAEAVARATHANIVQVYAVGEQDGLHYMALEYVEGCNLREYLLKKGPPEVPLAVSIIRQVAAGLQRAAELGIIHRDIKPENILLTRKGEIKVADFGLSRCLAGDQPALNLTQSGVAMGTPLYMSPEQVQGHTLDPRTDIYSFGVTCFHMLAGSPPFQGQTAFEVALQHVQTSARPLHEVRPDLPAELCAVVDKMMAKKPEHRYQSARELYQDASRLRAGLTRVLPAQKTQPAAVVRSDQRTSIWPFAGRWLQPGRRWLPWTVAASVFLSTASGAVLGWRSTKAPALPAVADHAPDQPAPDETAQQHREKILVEALQLYDNPAGGQELNLGLEQRVDLALLYLEQRRLDDADRFFSELVKNPYRIHPYELLGRIGQAIVSAFRDQAGQSLQQFEGLFGEAQAKKDRWKVRLVNQHPRLRRKIAEAMDRNAANAPSVPTDLEELRKAQPLRLQPPAGKVGLDKKQHKNT